MNSRVSPAPAHRSLELHGRNTVDVEAELRQALDLVESADVRQTGTGSLAVTHRFRPRWATVSGVALVPVLGVGLVLLAYRRQVTCEIRLLDSARGALITVTGQSNEVIDSAISSVAGSEPPDDVTQDRPALVGGVPRADPDSVSPADGAAPVGQREAVDDVLRVTFVGPLPDVVLRRTGRLIIGRDPVVREHERSQRLDDPHRTLSKTHAALGVDADGPYVEDLASTNGSLIHEDGLAVAALASGRRHRLTADAARLQFGGVECVVMVESAPVPFAAPSIEQTAVSTQAAEHVR